MSNWLRENAFEAPDNLSEIASRNNKHPGTDYYNLKVRTLITN